MEPSKINKTTQFNFKITSVKVIIEMKNLVPCLMKLARNNKKVTNIVKIVKGTGNAISPL